ncbi:hypothetical protein BCV70DRAFT_211292 [Testicularia cyperi]|uniref:AMMECR1 domain-containing protein n=1 Tax=Testicularia cyperi TaxID=1882483 RepID=A0A317XQ95_9BASI|nr:hypothetical protein BCV70DRAFT_211292 [Testicularia cyperi]
MSGAAQHSAARIEHCYFCFQVIEAELNDEPVPAAPFDNADDEFPLFVTWNIYSASQLSRRSSSSPRLRGCIGTFEPYALSEGLAEYASISAFKDRRFSPITPQEVPRLECGVSLLTGFEECQDYLDWEVGVHGIYIHLPNPALAPKSLLSGGNDDSASSSSGSGASTPAPFASAKKKLFGRTHDSGPAFLTATYLPDVIPEQNWTKQEAIDSAIRKAGYNGRITPDIRNALRVRRYRSEKVAATHAEYTSWRAAQQQQQ